MRLVTEKNLREESLAAVLRDFLAALEGKAVELRKFAGERAAAGHVNDGAMAEAKSAGFDEAATVLVNLMRHAESEVAYLKHICRFRQMNPGKNPQA